MSLLKNLLISSLLVILGALSTAASPVLTPLPCVVLQPGQYTISTAINNFLLRPFDHAFAAPEIIALSTQPVDQNGVWALANAPQAAYYISNVGFNVNVTVGPDIGAPLRPIAAPATAFSIECAGGDQYVVKNPVADQLWTAVPNFLVNITGADGDRTQLFLFTPV